MIEFHELRAEDFRKAWPTAYQQAILQIMVLHESAMNIQSVMTMQNASINKSIDAATKRMGTACDEMLAELTASNRSCQALLLKGIHLQQSEFEKLINQQKEFKQFVIKEQKELNSMKIETQKAIKKFSNAGFARRLLWAFQPRLYQQQAIQ